MNYFSKSVGTFWDLGLCEIFEFCHDIHKGYMFLKSGMHFVFQHALLEYPWTKINAISYP